MFVVIEASQGEDTRLFVLADAAFPNRFEWFAATPVCETIGKWRVDPQATSNVKRRRCGSPYA